MVLEAKQTPVSDTWSMLDRHEMKSLDSLLTSEVDTAKA
jgi:hypothetical protein